MAIDSPLQECKKAIEELSIMSEPKWHEIHELIELEKRFKASLAFELEKDIKGRFREIENIIDHYINIKNSSPINLEFSNSLKTRDLMGWSTAYHRLEEFESRSKLLAERELSYQSLKEQLPELENELRSNYKNSLWDERSKGFKEAWKWSLADTWLEDYETKHDSEKLNSSYVLSQQQIGKTTAKLAAAMAWNHCFKTMKHSQRTALLAWKDAIRRYGSGKRKGSARALKDAEHYMAVCRKTIPAWIMPLYRVVETVPMEPEIFDVVIVDEASQCGPEALIVHYLAKKVVIVGDSEQVAPENVGIEVEEVQRLRELYLTDVPIPDSLGRDNTLFDNAGLRLRESVFLQEHFRCMPEIIQFCNDLCYAPLRKSLIPLRQYKPDRLEPSIKTVYVESGYRDQSVSGSLKKTNHPEAKNVVEAIITCCNDPKYKDKTMGVISLLGNEQAKLIEGMLMKVLSPSEYEERKLLCGDPPSFQGDERDVIFISMVDATPSRLGALTKDTDKRRFNVAVSRAKDQLWVFHSYQLSDLKNHCFRHRLLHYCKNPHRITEDGDIERCKTQFEKDVYSDITRKGYKVIPQLEIAGKFIDLVVEGMRARLAVECDGDEWHGPDRWEADMERQRTLERCGWTFWRVRGSEYYRNPGEALSTLWDRLDDMQIYPQGDYEEFTDSDQKKGEEQQEKEEEMNDEDVEYNTREATDTSDVRQSYLFQTAKGTTKSIDPKAIRDIVIQLLEENSQGKDLLPTRVIRRAGLSARGRRRTRIANKINRVVKEMLRNGEIEQYKTQKRIRYRLSPK